MWLQYLWKVFQGSCRPYSSHNIYVALNSFDQNMYNLCFIYSWVGLVSKNYEIERACVELEKIIGEYEKKNSKVNWFQIHSKMLCLKILNCWFVVDSEQAISRLVKVNGGRVFKPIRRYRSPGCILLQAWISLMTCGVRLVDINLIVQLLWPLSHGWACRHK